MHRVHAEEEQGLAEGVDELFHPVQDGGAALARGEVAHGHVAQEGQHEHDNEALLFHLHRDDAQTRAHGAEAEHHHPDEEEGAGKERGRGEELDLFPAREHQNEAKAREQQADRLHRQEHRVEHMEVAEVQRVEELPQRLEKAREKGVDTAGGKAGVGVLGHLVVKVALHQHRRDREKDDGDEVRQSHQDRELVHGGPFLSPCPFPWRACR